jgi:hypothetical protein
MRLIWDLYGIYMAMYFGYLFWTKQLATIWENGIYVAIADSLPQAIW